MSDLKINNITNRTGNGGPVIAGVSTVSSTGSFIVPVGSTEMRGGRGRGIIAGGITPSVQNTIGYITIATTGNSTDFGDLVADRLAGAAMASSTRGIFAGGADASDADTTVIQYVTISSEGGSSNFGDLQQERGYVGGASNDIRGLIFGGAIVPGYTGLNSIEYITIATTGDASNFGDLTTAHYITSACASSTRGVRAGGSPAPVNVIDYVTIATLGDAIDFGDYLTPITGSAGVSSPTRGVFGPCNFGSSPTITNTIGYITIASTGNALDFGDATIARDAISSVCSTVRGVFAGGRTGPPAAEALKNAMDYITIASTGNALDFGDLDVAKRYTMGCSDAHGGLG